MCCVEWIEENWGGGEGRGAVSIHYISTGTFSKDVFSQGAVNWVFLGIFK